MTIATILGGKGREVVSVSADTRVGDVVALLASKRIGAVPVLEGGEVRGILSERDILYRLASDGAAMLELKAGDVMTSPAITVESSYSIMAALSLMTRRRIRHLPVVDANGVSGFVSIGDLVKARIEKIEAEAEAMRDYIQTA
jgi:CBS domain-containing protein